MKSIKQSIYQFINALKSGYSPYARRYAFAYILVSLFSLYSVQSHAQCCLTNTLTINTGYNPLTGGVAVGVDPHWRICSVDRQLLTDIIASGGVPAVGAADVIGAAPGWAAFPGTGSWISCFNGFHYNQSTTNNYNWTICRQFTLECDADVTFNFTGVSQDNWIMGGDVDGTAMTIPLTLYAGPGGLSGGPIMVFGGSPGVFLAIPSFTRHLLAGTHTMSIRVRNDNATSNNTGVAIAGTITTPSPSIWPENCILPHNCPVPGPAICVGSTASLTSAIAGGTWTCNPVAIATVNPTGVVTGRSPGTAIVTYTLPAHRGCPVYTTVTVNAAPSVTPILGPSFICLGSIQMFSDLTPGGTWSATGGVASVTGTGTLSGGAGFINLQGIALSPPYETITYTVSSACGTRSVTKVVAVMPIPHPTLPTPIKSICAGQSVPLTGLPGITGPYTISWSASPVGVVSITPPTGSNTVTITGMGTGGTATITYTITSIIGGAPGCPGSATMVVTVNPSPGPIMGPSAMCGLNTISLTDAVSGGIWSSSNNTVGTIDATGMLTGVGYGSTTVTYSVPPAGCYVTKVIHVEREPKPVIPNAPKAICVGQSITLTGVPNAPGGFYSVGWSSSPLGVVSITPPSGLSTVTITGSSAGTAIITYAVTSVYPGVINCTSYATTTINVIPSPGPIMGPSAMCGLNTISLTDAVSGGVWSSSNNTVGTIDATGMLTGVGYGSTTVTYSIPPAGCYVTKVIHVEREPKPVIPNAPKPICIGQSITLTGVPNAPGGLYLVGWSASPLGVVSITPPSGLSTVTITGSSAGTAIITYAVTSVYPGVINCTSYATTTITVVPSPGPISGPAAMCGLGNTITLSDAVPGGSWSSSNNTVGTIDGSGVLTGVGYGSTTVTYSIAPAGCYVTKVIHVEREPNPVLNNVPKSICVGQSVTVTGIPNAPGGFYSVNWSSSPLGVVNITPPAGFSTVTITGASPGTATITYAVTSVYPGIINCTSYATAVITVVPSPGPISGPAAMCGLGNTISLSDAVPGGSWSSSNSTVGTIDGSGVLTGVGYGSTTVTYSIVPAGCFVTKVIHVEREPMPIIRNGVKPICIGQSVTLTGVPNAPGGLYLVGWSASPLGVVSITPPSGSNTVTITGTGAGTATITYAVTSVYPGIINCTSYATTTITVYPSPTPILGGPVALCGIGLTQSLSDATPGGTWGTLDPSVATVDASGMVTSVSNGTATITYGFGGPCYATTTVTVGVTPTACVTVDYDCTLYPTGCYAVIFTGTPGATITYEEYDNTGTLVCTGLTITLGPTGTVAIPWTVFAPGCLTGFVVCITGVSLYGCPGTSTCCAHPNFSSRHASGIEQVMENNDVLHVIPNPNNGQFTINGTLSSASENEDMQLEVVNLLGQVVYKETFQAKNNLIDKTVQLSDNTPNGVYIIRLRNNDAIKSLQFTLNR